MNALKKADQALDKEMTRQIAIIYPACAIIWWKKYGWRETRIMRRFATSQEIWDECAGYGSKKSMVEMLEDETGIDLQLSGCEDWHKLSYMSDVSWDGKPLTRPQYIYMRGQQKKWIALLILAGICLSLYRDEHWGAERIGRFVSHVDSLRKELGERPDDFERMLMTETGLRPEVFRR